MRIVCATDLLPKSEAAIARAGMLADELRADLSLLHVVTPMDSERVLEQTLSTNIARMKARARPQLWSARTNADVAVRTGNPARLIVETLDKSRARLLVVGPHRTRSLRDTLEGTIAEKVLIARRWPLLVVRKPPRAAYQRVLLALDLSEASASAIRAAESLVLAPRAEVKIVHAHETPYEGRLSSAGVDMDTMVRYASGWEREARNAVRGLMHSESVDLERYDITVENGRPAPAILRAIEGYRPDLIVMGTRARGRLRRALLGSVANRVLHESSCDALVVPEDSWAAHDIEHVSR